VAGGGSGADRLAGRAGPACPVAVARWALNALGVRGPQAFQR
jgi:hypothetical protein